MAAADRVSLHRDDDRRTLQLHELLRADRDFFDVARVSALRAAESRLALRLVHGEHCALDEVEAPLRLRGGDWTLDWYRAHRKLVDAFVMHAAPDDEIESWATAMRRVLRSTDADEIWLPLGVGSHVDHELARNACLRALARIPDLERRVPLYFYQEVPYAAQFPHHTARIVDSLSAAGAKLERCVTDISQSLEAKTRLASVYVLVQARSACGRSSRSPRGGRTDRRGSRASFVSEWSGCRGASICSRRTRDGDHRGTRADSPRMAGAQCDRGSN